MKHRPDATSQPTERDYRVVIDPGRFVACLARTACSLVLVHVALYVYHSQVKPLPRIPWLQLFDLDEESNIPTRSSGAILGVAAFWTWVVAQARRAASDDWWRRGTLLALGFVFPPARATPLFSPGVSPSAAPSAAS